MSKYIDADQLRKEIDKRYAEYRAKMKTDDFTYYEGMADALDLFEQFLDTLPEQNPPKWKIADKPIFGAMYIVRKVYGALVEHAVSGCVHKGDEYIIVKELDILPKED